jgi:hypothetical protein
MYISFYGFKKIQISAQKSNALAFGFIEKRQFATKTDQNFAFFGREAQISDQFYIMVLYIIFYEFFKNSNFGSKFKCLSLRFYRKTLVCDKN